MKGLILLHKPKGITSFEALGLIKQKLKTGRVGHAGTLDCFATGLLLVLVGDYTRLISLFQNEEKEYEALIEFGRTTTTLDPEGEITETGPLPALKDLMEISKDFCGELDQVPPLYSAIQINGRRASELARQGHQPQLKSRRIKISLLELVAYQPPYASLRIVCSKGTYIRALARDLALALQTKAYVKELERTRIGAFHLKQAVKIEEFDITKDIWPATSFLTRLKACHLLVIKEEFRRLVGQGQRLKSHYFTSNPQPGLNAVLDPKGELLAVIEVRQEGSSYLAVFNNKGLL